MWTNLRLKSSRGPIFFGCSHHTFVFYIQEPMRVSHWLLGGNIYASGKGKRKVTILKHIEPSVVLNKAYSQGKLFYQSLNCSGEGNGSPLQYSCLENPMDGGAW